VYLQKFKTFGLEIFTTANFPFSYNAKLIHIQIIFMHILPSYGTAGSMIPQYVFCLFLCYKAWYQGKKKMSAISKEKIKICVLTKIQDIWTEWPDIPISHNSSAIFLEMLSVCLRFISTRFGIFGAIFSYFLDRQSWWKN
jgi:hypothetical protein